MPRTEPERERTTGEGEEQTFYSSRIRAEAASRQRAQRAIDAVNVDVHQIVESIASAID